MSTIRILPEILSNQIAAGEVVERPVSIVKELVENSIDAGAGQISVEIVNGGKSLIRVSDDGSGLSRDDALLAIERYATSKIYTSEDLFSISTMGFRGEALPSIASVSKFTLVTRPRDNDTGTRIEMAGGRMLNVTDTGAPVGTMVEVKSLFYNTPARKKFLKSDQTESGHIRDAIFGLALGHSNIRFRLFVNQKLQKHFSSSDDLFQRAVHVIGRESADQLYPIEFKDSVLKIHGFCSNPVLTRSSSSKIFLFVNHRLIYDRGLISAIFRGYKGRIMKGRFPAGVLFIDIGYDQVDVNVHPSKKEVKFFDSQRVYASMARAIEQALEKGQEDLTVYSKVNIKDEGVKEKKSFPFEFSSQNTDGSGSSNSVQARFTWPKRPEHDDSIGEKEEPGSFQSAGIAKLASDDSFIKKIRVQHDLVSKEPRKDDENQNETGPPDDRSELTVVGQILGNYILVESGEGLIMVDQHAAHERIVYEKLKRRFERLDIQSQMLALPETIDLGFKEADTLEKMLPHLERLGFRIEPFGGATFVIKSVPLLLEKGDIAAIIKDMIDAKDLSGQDDILDQWIEECLILMACHNTIRANKKMNIIEMQSLVEELEACENSRHCPHGRPIQVFWSRYQIEKLFKRVV